MAKTGQVATAARTVNKRAVRILVECFVVFLGYKHWTVLINFTLFVPGHESVRLFKHGHWRSNVFHFHAIYTKPKSLAKNRGWRLLHVWKILDPPLMFSVQRQSSMTIWAVYEFGGERRHIIESELL